MVEPLPVSDLGRTCFISPHFDDAVLSCSELIAAVTDGLVVTIFSGGPARVDPLPKWDRECGFSAGDDVPGLRAAEDAAALACLGATGYGLGLWDAQYRTQTPYWIPEFAARLVREMNARRGPTAADIAVLGKDLVSYKIASCVIPLGISHRDHRLAAQACLKLAKLKPDIRWLVYEDLPYAVESAEARGSAIAALERAGFRLGDVELELHPDAARKRQALDCYPTQLRALGDRTELAIATPERYHLLRAVGA
jgi:LmbE family N-acetylglucosaminyl deacetylase